MIYCLCVFYMHCVENGVFGTWELHYNLSCLNLPESIHFFQSGPVLVPAGLATRGTRQKAKSMKLEEVTKPMNSAANAQMQQILLRRLLKCHKDNLVGSAAKDCLHILTVLTSSLSPFDCAGEFFTPVPFNFQGKESKATYLNVALTLSLPHFGPLIKV